MKKKTPAKTSEEFDRRFDSGEDIHDLLDMSCLFRGKCPCVPEESVHLFRG